MREIKFQSIHEHYDTKEVVFSEWGPQGLGSFSGPSSISGYKLIGHRQFTGLKDKNGVEIYEGDIVFHEMDECNEEVFYNERTGAFKRRCLDFDNTCLDFMSGTYKYCEVIGNIYQNPELLNIKP